MTPISLDQGDTQRIGSVYSARIQRFQSVYLPVLNHIKVIGVAMLQYGASGEFHKIFILWHNFVKICNNFLLAN